jgi:hypothetical protein
MPKTLPILGAALAGAVMTLTGAGSALAAGSGTIYVPDDFNPVLSDTRATGHYAVQGTGLHVWTEGSTSTDKVAEYVDVSAPLASIGEPSMEYTPISGSVPPGYQLVVDFDGDSSADGILVGEPSFYGDVWWLNNAAKPFVKAGAPHNPGSSGSADGYDGTLDEWRAAFPDAQVVAFGFSLGSGVKGDGVINAMTFDGTRYTFATHVVLTGKDQCKNGGWATSTMPVFKNQGDCVSSFAGKK